MTQKQIPQNMEDWNIQQHLKNKANKNISEPNKKNRQFLKKLKRSKCEMVPKFSSGVCFYLLCFLIRTGITGTPPQPYYGRFIGHFSQVEHGIRGSVYAVDESTILIRDFAYDGVGSGAYFFVGKTIRPSPEGFIIPYPEKYKGLDPPFLQAHKNSNMILRFPMGRRLKDIRWLSVWCPRFTVDLGSVFIPKGLNAPKPRVLPEFNRLVPGIRSGNISVLDMKTFYVPNFHFDGTNPDAYFWVGKGTEPNLMGTKVPDEIGSNESLRTYQGEDIEIQLPGKMTVYDIDWLAVWCIELRKNFGDVQIPKDLNIPPALGQTRLSKDNFKSNNREKI